MNNACSGQLDYFGYRDCPCLDNGAVRVVLGPHCGGRVLEYSWRGHNVLYLDPAQAGRVWQAGEPEFIPGAGRFDVGLNQEMPARPQWWLGAWESGFTETGGVRLTSAVDPATQLQLAREFELDCPGSRLRCVQTIMNRGRQVIEVASWGRTFVVGGGVFVTPVRANSVHPGGFVVHKDGVTIPPHADPNVTVEDGLFVVRDIPRYRWYGLDSYADWLAYAPPGDLLFVKRFPVYPHRRYGRRELCNIVLWHMGGKYCELEPFGPIVRLEPGQQTSFCEDWWLVPGPRPADRRGPCSAAIGETVRRHTRRVEWDESLIGPSRLGLG